MKAGRAGGRRGCGAGKGGGGVSVVRGGWVLGFGWWGFRKEGQGWVGKKGPASGITHLHARKLHS